jgi:hypothetical protein
MGKKKKKRGLAERPVNTDHKKTARKTPAKDDQKKKGEQKAGWRALSAHSSGDDDSADDFEAVPDNAAIRKTNSEAAKNRSVMRGVRTFENHWAKVHKAAPNKKNWTDENLASVVAARCEEHCNPSQRKAVLSFLKHTAALLKLPNPNQTDQQTKYPELQQQIAGIKARPRRRRRKLLQRGNTRTHFSTCTMSLTVRSTSPSQHSS